jgi:formylglycine-generating enzyme required for sulfatase activity
MNQLRHRFHLSLGVKVLLCVLCFSIGLGFGAGARDRGNNPATDYVDLNQSRIALVKVPAGAFEMGTAQVITAQPNWDNDVERPVHMVRISKGFWMGKFSVTQRQWQDVMGNNPSYWREAGPDAPVEQVSWNDVQAFLAKVNHIQTRWTVRLPTEAEWEYAARAGTSAETYGPLEDIAWFDGNNTRTTHAVGQKLPNAFGLYDM